MNTKIFINTYKIKMLIKTVFNQKKLSLMTIFYQTKNIYEDLKNKNNVH